jgi:hypothetical protein
MIIKEHDFSGGKGCVHCNSKDPATTCRPREVPDPTPSGPRTSAVNDFDVINRRLKELEDERAAAQPKSDSPVSFSECQVLLDFYRFWLNQQDWVREEMNRISRIPPHLLKN